MKYRKLSVGAVELKGLIYCNSSHGGNAYQFPVDFRPAETTKIHTQQNTSLVLANIDAAGILTIDGNNSTNYELAAIFFM